MRRSPPFDPPEYVSWKPDPALVRAYRATCEADPARAAVVSGLSADGQLALYAGLLRARLHDIQLQRWVRTGVISKAWLFFFQAEDGIRDVAVTGVQTCALPI